MDDAALHAAGDRDELAADVAGEHVRGEDDDLRRHVLGLGDLAQGHRPRDAPHASGSTWPRVIGDSVQPGATALTRARGATRVTSFFSDSSSPPCSAAFAAA